MIAMRRYLLAGGGVVAVMLAVALVVQRCAGYGAASTEPAPVTAGPAPLPPAAVVLTPQSGPDPAVPVRTPASKATSALSAKIANHLAAPAAPSPGPALSAADAALLEAAKDFERDVWPKGEDRSGVGLTFSEEGFATLLDSLEVQMAHDPGARELSQLFGDGARGKLPADGSTRLERLACGMRLCAAHFETDTHSSDLPRLGYNSMSGGTPLPGGGMRHRLIFSIDPDLHIAQPPSPRQPRAGG